MKKEYEKQNIQFSDMQVVVSTNLIKAGNSSPIGSARVSSVPVSQIIFRIN